MSVWQQDLRTKQSLVVPSSLLKISHAVRSPAEKESGEKTLIPVPSLRIDSAGGKSFGVRVNASVFSLARMSNDVGENAMDWWRRAVPLKAHGNIRL